MLFFDPEELSTGVIAERLKAYEVDTVLWFLPFSATRETALRLSDAGVRLVGITTQGENSSFECKYQLGRTSAASSLLKEWKMTHKVDRVSIVECKESSSMATRQMLREALEHLKLEFKSVYLNGEDPGRFISALHRAGSEGIVFASAMTAAHLAFRNPGALLQLMKSHRIALLEGPVSMPFVRVPEVLIDLVTWDWQEIAEQIVEDLSSQFIFKETGRRVFEAQTHFRVPLSQFAQQF